MCQDIIKINLIGFENEIDNIYDNYLLVSQ